MPEEWNIIIIQFVQIGDKSYCWNYKDISLLKVAYKILVFIIAKELKPHVIRT